MRVVKLFQKVPLWGQIKFIEENWLLIRITRKPCHLGCCRQSLSLCTVLLGTRWKDCWLWLERKASQYVNGFRAQVHTNFPVADDCSVSGYQCAPLLISADRWRNFNYRSIWKLQRFLEKAVGNLSFSIRLAVTLTTLKTRRTLNLNPNLTAIHNVDQRYLRFLDL